MVIRGENGGGKGRIGGGRTGPPLGPRERIISGYKFKENKTDRIAEVICFARLAFDRTAVFIVFRMRQNNGDTPIWVKPYNEFKSEFTIVPTAEKMYVCDTKEDILEALKGVNDNGQQS